MAIDDPHCQIIRDESLPYPDCCGQIACEDVAPPLPPVEEPPVVIAPAPEEAPKKHLKCFPVNKKKQH